MRRLRLPGLATLALLAGVVPTSSASATLVMRQAGAPLPPGGELHKAAIRPVFRTAAGTLTCETMVLESEVVTNSAKKDLGKVTSASAFGDFMEIPGACETSSFGPATVEITGVPLSVVISEKGTAEFKSVEAKKIALATTFLAAEGPNNSCTFEASKVKSTFVPGTQGAPAPMTLVVTEQKFKLNKKAPDTSALCPTSGTLNGNFEVTSEGGPVETEAFKVKK